MPYWQCYGWFITNYRHTEINQPRIKSDFSHVKQSSLVHSKSETHSVSQNYKKKNTVASHYNPIVFLVKSPANISTSPPRSSHRLNTHTHSLFSLLQKESGGWYDKPSPWKSLSIRAVATELLCGGPGRSDRNAAPNPLFIKVAVERCYRSLGPHSTFHQALTHKSPLRFHKIDDVYWATANILLIFAHVLLLFSGLSVLRCEFTNMWFWARAALQGVISLVEANLSRWSQKKKKPLHWIYHSSCHRTGHLFTSRILFGLLSCFSYKIHCVLWI